MAHMRQMKSMELDDDDKIDHVTASPMLNSDFPYGLRIALTEKEFEKLGLDHAEAEVGGIVHGHFIGRVTSCHAEKESCRVEIQIEDLEIESEDEENEEKE